MPASMYSSMFSTSPSCGRNGMQLFASLPSRWFVNNMQKTNLHGRSSYGGTQGKQFWTNRVNRGLVLIYHHQSLRETLRLGHDELHDQGPVESANGVRWWQDHSTGWSKWRSWTPNEPTASGCWTHLNPSWLSSGPLARSTQKSHVPRKHSLISKNSSIYQRKLFALKIWSNHDTLQPRVWYFSSCLTATAGSASKTLAFTSLTCLPWSHTTWKQESLKVGRHHMVALSATYIAHHDIGIQAIDA